eukprot:TRINITY_DN794_c0_g1_i2.p1 TRINITY_DN794_c0_g1~~TRINITY_DN794_c0_g1_i2.p1  ORF type:complete len:430 (+),score=61.85 TRINITY_DN794_c0_g1_i2:95-1291(+)
MAALLMGALKEGWLTKQGGTSFKNWKLRYFVLTKDALYYFENEGSGDPLGVIPMKDYLKCRGMEGSAYSVVKKDNSLFLEVPWRVFKMFATRWQDSESWAESISCLGEFMRKREEIRSPSPYQSSLLKLQGDIISFGSSLNHWYKMSIDSTPSYRNGIHSIYLNAVKEHPNKLGEGILKQTRMVLHAVNSSRNPQMFEKILVQAPKVLDTLITMSKILAICSDSHKGSFTSDFGVVKKALEELINLRPSFPLDEITNAAIVVAKSSKKLATDPFGLSTDPEDEDDIARPSKGGASSSSSGGGVVSEESVAANLRDLARVIDSNIALLKKRPLGGQEQMYCQGMTASFQQVEAGVHQIIRNFDANGRHLGPLGSVSAEVTRHCKDIVAAAEKLFSDFTD